MNRLTSRSFILTMLLACTASARAEYIPPFDLDTCVGEAKVIVRGTLDPQGDITVADSLRKQVELPQKVKLYGGDYQYESLQKTMDARGPIQVTVFLVEDSTLGWRTVQYSPAIVGFNDENVFLVEGGDFQNYLQKSKRFTKAGFLTALQDAIKRKEERERLAALPRSLERTTQLVNFATRNDQNGETGRFPMFHEGRYELGQIARAFKAPTIQEQETILDALRRAKIPGEQIVILNLSEWIPLKDEAMDVVGAYLPRNNVPRVREAAMDALRGINAYKAVDYLVPYLVLDDPQLASVLRNFGSQSYPPQDQLLNIHAVDALKKLAETIKGPDHVPIENGYVIGAVSGQLCHYLHPKLLPLLYAKAIHGDDPSSAQVFSNFSSALGLQFDREDKTSWEAWWKKAQSLLEGDFNLQTAAGRALWMNHYAQADPATQKILMNLWFFEVNIDEAALIDLAEKNEVAKQVLAELWKRERLSENGKQAIVKRFLTFRLVNDPPEEAAKDKSLYGVRLSTISAFPFPDRAMVRNKIVVTVGDKINTDDGSKPSDCELPLYKEGKEFSTMSWWASFPSPPQANASVEYRGLDFPNSWDEIWTLTWKVEPIQLTNASP